MVDKLAAFQGKHKYGVPGIPPKNHSHATTQRRDERLNPDKPCFVMHVKGFAG